MVNVRYMQRKRLIDRFTAARQRAPIDCCYVGGSVGKSVDVKDKREDKTSRFALINQGYFSESTWARCLNILNTAVLWLLVILVHLKSSRR